MSSKQHRLLVKSVEEGVGRFDPFLVLQVPCGGLCEEDVKKAHDAKISLASEFAESDDVRTQLKTVVDTAYRLLSDPGLRSACVEAVQASTKKRNEYELMDRFEALISGLTTGKSGGVSPVLTAQRSEKRKERKKALKTLQEKQLQDKQDILLYDIHTTSRERKTLEKMAVYDDMVGSDSSTEPRTPPSDDMEEDLLDHQDIPENHLNASMGVGGVVAYRHLITSCVSGGLFYDHLMCNTMKKSVRSGRQPLPAADSAALSLLERHGFVTLSEEGDIVTATPLPASRKDIVETIDVRSGCVGSVVPWIVPVCTSTQSKAHITLKGSTDTGSLPVAAYEGYCHIASLFSCRAEIDVVKRKGNHLNTAVLKVAPTVFTTPLTLVEPSPITSLDISVWVSKGVSLDVGGQVAQTALNLLSKDLPDALSSVTPNLSLWKEDGVVSDVIFISISMKAASGGLWCGWSQGGRGTKAAHTGERAALQLIKDYIRGGLVPDYLQEHLALFMSCCPADSCSRVLMNPPTPALNTAVALLGKTHPKIAFSFSTPSVKGRGKRCTILECRVSAE